MGFKFPHTLKDEARDECYEYFDKNIRELKKDSSGNVDAAADGLQNNDVDAFRHAYVSGVMTQEYSESTADILGRLNEYHPIDKMIKSFILGWSLCKSMSLINN